MKKITYLLLFTFWGTLLYSQNIVVDGVTFSADGSILIKYPEDKVDEKYIVPEGTVVIGKEAFNGTKYLKELSLPLSLNIIEDYAFTLCYNLSIVTWKHFPQSIGELLFMATNISVFYTSEDSDNCISVDGVLFSKDRKTLLCFPNAKKCNGGIYIIPESVESINTGAFVEAGIGTVVLPSTLTRINDFAFYYGPSNFVITGKFPIIGSHVWNERRSFEVSADNPYCQVSENGFVYSKDGKTVHVAPIDIVDYLENIEIIDRYAFQDCLFYSGHVDIPGSVNLIREHAFDDIQIPIPTFSKSFHDINFVCDALTPPELDGEVFTEDNVGNSTLLVPKESEELYKNTPQWNTFGTIVTPGPPQGITENSVSSLKVNRVDGAIYIETLKPMDTVRLIELNGNIVREKSQVNSCRTICDISSLDGFFGLLQAIYKDGNSEVFKLNF
ncbi:leucine-rich repeat domain-containing protein [Bacteroides salyersiae]|uniref:leucine-rich repeat domain-containing protein n=1 Tax=Bacteroides salyersiae TaxID=291644 RepID=UPI001C8B1D4F|nr:leucine-rich repeat domain-containing protein [Bacteroides salyersiae]